MVNSLRRYCGSLTPLTGSNPMALRRLRTIRTNLRCFWRMPEESAGAYRPERRAQAIKVLPERPLARSVSSVRESSSFSESRLDFAGGDLVRSGTVKAQLADTETASDSKRRTEEATGHGTSDIEVAEAGGWIEGGTRLVVGEVLEEIGARLVENAGFRIAGKLGRQSVDGRLSTTINGGCAFRIGGCQRGQSFAEAGGIELRDWKNTDAALGATGRAEQPGTGAASGIGYSGVDNLNELRVAVRQHAFSIVDPARQPDSAPCVHQGGPPLCGMVANRRFCRASRVIPFGYYPDPASRRRFSKSQEVRGLSRRDRSGGLRRTAS